SLTLCWRNWNYSFRRRWTMFSDAPVTKLSTQTSFQPSANKRSHRCDPRKPAPPVTTARRPPPCPPPNGEGILGATDAAVDKTAVAHGLRVEDVPAVDDNRPTHQALHAIEIELSELVPFGHHQQCVGALCHGVG